MEKRIKHPQIKQELFQPTTKKPLFGVSSGIGKSFYQEVSVKGYGKNQIKIKLQEMYGINPTDEQVDELEKVVLASKGFHVITEEDIKNSKSLRFNPTTGEIN